MRNRTENDAVGLRHFGEHSFGKSCAHLCQGLQSDVERVEVEVQPEHLAGGLEHVQSRSSDLWSDPIARQHE